MQSFAPLSNSLRKAIRSLKWFVFSGASVWRLGLGPLSHFGGNKIWKVVLLFAVFHFPQKFSMQSAASLSNSPGRACCGGLKSGLLKTTTLTLTLTG